MDDNYERDEFYETRELTLTQKKKILKDAYKCSFKWHVDILDARKSWQRQKIEMSFEDALKKLDKDCHYVFIHRKGFKGSRETYPNEYVLEIGFSTMKGEPTYFLFIFCDQEKLPEFISKYNLIKHIV
jgi:hypothetical protein